MFSSIYTPPRLKEGKKERQILANYYSNYTGVNTPMSSYRDKKQTAEIFLSTACEQKEGCAFLSTGEKGKAPLSSLLITQ